jgi:hypothetical protein
VAKTVREEKLCFCLAGVGEALVSFFAFFSVWLVLEGRRSLFFFAFFCLAGAGRLEWLGF